MKKYAADFPPAIVARDQLKVGRRRAFDPREPARQQGAQRRLAGLLTGAKPAERGS